MSVGRQTGAVLPPHAGQDMIHLESGCSIWFEPALYTRTDLALAICMATGVTLEEVWPHPYGWEEE